MDEDEKGAVGSVPSEALPSSADSTGAQSPEVVEEKPVKPKTSKGKTLLVIAVVAAVAALGYWLVNRATAIESAAEECEQTLSVADDGKTIRLHVWGDDVTNPDIFTHASMESMTCILDELETPTAVRDHMGQTRALDGQQTDEWGSFTARWTYHPDEGIQLTIREQ